MIETNEKVNAVTDDLAARREARRRKILENSQTRLNKILGVTGKNTLDNSVPEQNLVYESVFGIPQSYEIRPLPTRTTTNDVPEESLLDSLCSDSDNVPDRPITAFEKFLATKVHILLLSILTYMSIYSEILIIPVFIPFILSEISEVILFHRQTEKPGLLYLLFLNKVSKTKINTIVNVFHIINKICNDFAIYMLTFILMHAFISLFDDT